MSTDERWLGDMAKNYDWGQQPSAHNALDDVPPPPEPDDPYLDQLDELLNKPDPHAVPGLETFPLISECNCRPILDVHMPHCPIAEHDG